MREIETISSRTPIPASAVSVWSSEILAKANMESAVICMPSLSMMPRTTTGSLDSRLTGCPGAIWAIFAANLSWTSRLRRSVSTATRLWANRWLGGAVL